MCLWLLGNILHCYRISTRSTWENLRFDIHLEEKHEWEKPIWAYCLHKSTLKGSQRNSFGKDKEFCLLILCKYFIAPCWRSLIISAHWSKYYYVNLVYTSWYIDQKVDKYHVVILQFINIHKTLLNVDIDTTIQMCKSIISYFIYLDEILGSIWYCMNGELFSILLGTWNIAMNIHFNDCKFYIIVEKNLPFAGR